MDPNKCADVYFDLCKGCTVHDIYRYIPKTDSGNEWIKQTTGHISIWTLVVNAIRFFLEKNYSQYPNIWHAYINICDYENKRPEPTRAKSIRTFNRRKIKRKKRFIYILLISINDWLKSGKDFDTNSMTEFENHPANTDGGSNPIKIENWQDRNRKKGRSYGRNNNIGINNNKLTYQYFNIYNLLHLFAKYASEKLLETYECTCSNTSDNNIDLIISKINFEELILKNRIEFKEFNITLIKNYLTEKLKAPISWTDFLRDFSNYNIKMRYYNYESFNLVTNDNLIVNIRKYFLESTSSTVVYLDPNITHFYKCSSTILLCGGDTNIPYLKKVCKPNVCFVCDKIPKTITTITYNGKFTKITQEENFGTLHTCTSCVLLLSTCINRTNINKPIVSNTLYSVECESNFPVLFNNSYPTMRNCYKMYLILCGMDNIKCLFNDFNRDIVSYIFRFIFALCQ